MSLVVYFDSITLKYCLANRAKFILLKTQFKVFNLGLKWIRGVDSWVRGLTGPLGLALNPANNPLIQCKPKLYTLNLPKSTYYGLYHKSR